MLWSFLYRALCALVQLIALRLRSSEHKELEILVLRHELAIARRQAVRTRASAVDRALLAALSRALPRPAWSAFSVTPRTLMRWHRRLVARRWTYASRALGRPPLDSELTGLIALLARENPTWGYRRIVGELAKLGLQVSASSVRSVLKRSQIPPAPRRSGPSWRDFLRAQAQSVVACDFLTVDTVWLRRIYVLFFIELHTRRVWLAGCTENPDGGWVTQQARNVAFDLDPRERSLHWLIHDRDSKFSAAFDAVFKSEGIEVIRTPIKAPNANAHAERFVRTLRAECLDWLLIFGRRQLERALREYVDHYNRARPHRALALRPPDPTPQVIPMRPRGQTRPRRRDRLGGLIHEYAWAA